MTDQPIVKRVKVYVHRDKGDNYELAEKLKLPDEATRVIRDLGYEIVLAYEINLETGESKLIGADGYYLSPDPITWFDETKD